MENTITDILFNGHLSTMHAVQRVDKIIVKVSYHVHLYSTLALLQRVYYNNEKKTLNGDLVNEKRKRKLSFNF